MVYKERIMSTPVSIQPKTYTQAEFAAKLGVSRGTLYNMRKRPQANVPLPLNTGLKKLLFRDTDVDAYVRYGATWDLR
jgi:predicted DNA-binding transcriptional regulator AlpA